MIVILFIVREKENEVGISSIRGGTIFGEHTVMFAGQDEIVEVKQYSSF